MPAQIEIVPRSRAERLHSYTDASLGMQFERDPDPPAPATPEPLQAPEPSAPLERPRPRENPLRYWMRPLLLAALVVVLLVFTQWEHQRVPNGPVRPDVLTATPASGTASSTSDPALQDVMSRLRSAVLRRDARALAALADPDGVLVAPYSGGLPDGGPAGIDAQRLSQDMLSGAQVSLLGWRSDGRGRIIVLSDGWPRKPLRLGQNAALELTPLSAIGLVARGSTWYWRSFSPDPSGVLAQQARTMVWQP